MSGLEPVILNKVQQVLDKTEVSGGGVELTIPNTLGYIPDVGTPMTMEKGTGRLNTVDNTWHSGAVTATSQSIAYQSAYSVSSETSDGGMFGILLGNYSSTDRTDYNRISVVVLDQENNITSESSLNIDLNASATSSETVPRLVQMGVDKWALILYSYQQTYKRAIKLITYSPVDKEVTVTTPVSGASTVTYSRVLNAVYSPVNDVLYLAETGSNATLYVSAFDTDLTRISIYSIPEVTVGTSHNGLMVTSEGSLLHSNYGKAVLKLDLVDSVLVRDDTFSTALAYWNTTQVTPVAIDADIWMYSAGTSTTRLEYDIVTNTLNGTVSESGVINYNAVINSTNDKFAFLPQTHQFIAVTNRFAKVYQLDDNNEFIPNTVPKQYPTYPFLNYCSSSGENRGTLTYITPTIPRTAYKQRGAVVGRFTIQQVLGEPCFANIGDVVSASETELTLKVTDFSRTTNSILQLGDSTVVGLLPECSKSMPKGHIYKAAQEASNGWDNTYQAIWNYTNDTINGIYTTSGNFATVERTGKTDAAFGWGGICRGSNHYGEVGVILDGVLIARTGQQVDPTNALVYPYGSLYTHRIFGGAHNRNSGYCHVVANIPLTNY